MVRNKGFIDLDKILNSIGVNTSSLNSVLDSDKIQNIDTAQSIVFLFKYLNKNYFYKSDPIFSPYTELIGTEMLKDFNLPYVDYDLASVSGSKGVISEDYKEKNSNYISGYQLLYDFYGEDFIDNVAQYDNLESIWDALLYRYKDNPNKDNIVSNLMNRITDLYIFDIIVANSDRHPDNFAIVESKDNIDIAPIYDNSRMLLSVNHTKAVTLTVDEVAYEELYSSLDKFINVSDTNFLNKIKDKLWIIDEENILDIFDRVQNKIGYSIPGRIKNFYINKLKEHRNRLEEIINSNTRKR